MCADDVVDRYVSAHEFYHAYEYECKTQKFEDNDVVTESLASIYGSIRAKDLIYTESNINYTWIKGILNDSQKEQLIESIFTKKTGIVNQEYLMKRIVELRNTT
jgi:hypothetical protein